jgi:hypothetical protein
MPSPCDVSCLAERAVARMNETGCTTRVAVQHVVSFTYRANPRIATPFRGEIDRLVGGSLDDLPYWSEVFPHRTGSFADYGNAAMATIAEAVETVVDVQLLPVP